MNRILLGTAAIMVAAIAGPVSAQVPEQCADKVGPIRDSCIQRVKRTQQSEASSGKLGSFAKADAKLVNDSIAAADAKLKANDFDGAAAVYQAAIATAPSGPVAHHLNGHLATVLRRQAVYVYNNAPKPVYPPPGSPNQAIRDANASNAKIIEDRRVKTTTLLQRSLDASTRAATLADASKDRSADGAIGGEIKEAGSLYYKIDPTGVVSKPRPTVDVEVAWLRKWLPTTKPADTAQVADYGFATAAALIAKDPAAGWALADEVLAKTGDSVDGAIGYGELAVATKTSISAATKAKATAALAAAAPKADAAQQARIKTATDALARPN